MTQRRVVVRDKDGIYGIGGLIPADAAPKPPIDDGEGTQFKLAGTFDHYILYVPDVVEMVADPVIPDAWKPFVEHGITPWPAQP